MLHRTKLTGIDQIFPFAKKGIVVTISYHDDEITVWNLEEPEKAPWVLPRNQEYVAYMAYDEKNQKLYTCSYENEIRIWDLNNPTQGAKVLKEFQPQMIELALAPNGWLYAATSEQLMAWDSAKESLAPTSIPIDGDSPNKLLLHPTNPNLL